jgi:hypothetical protein
MDALIGILTQRFDGTPSPSARTSGQNDAGLDIEAAVASASLQAAMAIAESYLRHLLMERLLRGEGKASEESRGPEYLLMLETARESALRQAGRKVTIKETEEDDDEEVDRGVGTQAELPPGVPMWPPRVFLSRDRTYKKIWHKWILKQGESNRSESDPRTAAGDVLSVMMLCLDYSQVADKLALKVTWILRGLYLSEGDVLPRRRVPGWPNVRGSLYS